MSQQDRNQKRNTSLLEIARSKSKPDVKSGEYVSPFASLENQQLKANVRNASSYVASPEMKHRSPTVEKPKSGSVVKTISNPESHTVDPFAVKEFPLTSSLFTSGFRGVSPSVTQSNGVFDNYTNVQSKIEEIHKPVNSPKVNSPFKNSPVNHQLQMTPNLITKARSGSPSRAPIVKSGSPKPKEQNEMSISEKIKNIREQASRPVQNEQIVVKEQSDMSLPDKVKLIRETAMSVSDKTSKVSSPMSVSDRVKLIRSSSPVPAANKTKPASRTSSPEPARSPMSVSDKIKLIRSASKSEPVPVPDKTKPANRTNSPEPARSPMSVSDKIKLIRSASKSEPVPVTDKTTSSEPATMSVSDRVKMIRSASKTGPGEPVLLTDKTKPASRTNSPEPVRSPMSISDRVKLIRSASKLNSSEPDVIPVSDGSKPAGKPSSPERSGMSVSDRIRSITEKTSTTKSPERSAMSGMSDKVKLSRSATRTISPSRSVVETMKDLKENIIEKAEHVLEPHLAKLAKHGFVVDRIFHDRDAGCVYLNTYNKIGTNFVIEVVHKSAEGLYLSDGHVLSKHTGEEFDLSKQFVEGECKLTGECGLFVQQGDKLVVVKSGEGQLHKESYIVSTIDSEKSLLEENNIIAVPVVHLEQLEGDEESIAQLMMLVNIRYQEYFFKAASDSEKLLLGAIGDLKGAESVYSTFINEYRIAIRNSAFKLQIVDKNLIFHKLNGNEEEFELAAVTRRELFEDTLNMILASREISTIIEHAANTKRACEHKLQELRTLGVKYM